MVEVVGIRFKSVGKIYYFDPCGFDLETGMHAIVETARGVEMGTVLLPPRDVEDEKVIQPLKPVLRIDNRFIENEPFGLHVCTFLLTLEIGERDEVTA